MSRECKICGKRIVAGNNVSHSHKKTKRTWKPNLQTTKVTLNGKVQKARICTRCLKKGKILNTA